MSDDYDDESAKAMTVKIKDGLRDALAKAHLDYLELLPDEDYIEAGVWFGMVEYLSISMAILFRDRISTADIDDELASFCKILAMYVKEDLETEDEAL